MTDIENRREKLKKRIEQDKARLKNLEAKQRQQERKKDTRRKVIAGALALEHSGIDPEFGKTMFKLLNRYVKRDQDRVLFAEIFEGFPETAPHEPAPEQDQGSPIRNNFKSQTASGPGNRRA